jgi:hypothetical protein
MGLHCLFRLSYCHRIHAPLVSSFLSEHVLQNHMGVVFILAFWDVNETMATLLHHPLGQLPLSVEPHH